MTRCQRCAAPARPAVVDGPLTWAGQRWQIALCQAHAEVFASMLGGWTKRKRPVVPIARPPRGLDPWTLRVVPQQATQRPDPPEDLQRNRSSTGDR